MDQFGVLVESIGFKSQGRSAPMADLKGKISSNNGFPQNLGTKSSFATHPSSINRSKSPQNSNSVDATFIDDLDGIFRSSNNRGPQNYSGSNGYDDIFGWPNANSKPPGSESMFDLDSVFKGSSNLGSKSSASLLYDDADDIFGKMPELKSPETVNYDKVFGSVGSPQTQSDSIDDLLGDFGRMGSRSNGSRRNSGKMKKNASESDDLIPGFGGSSPSSNGEIKAKEERVSREQRVKEKDKVQRRIGDETEAFEFGNDLESFFSMGAQSCTGRRHMSSTEDSLFDTLFQNREGSKVDRTSSGTSSSKNKASSVIDSVEDFSFLFGSGAAPSSGEFQEVEGESEERRRARLNHYLRTQQRMAKALDEKNRRDLETQREQEERHRLAETLDDGIKRWAAGKEGNLRALLSSLQYVLWPECGWQQVSLTDLITSVSVKKVYYKATLCVHPDKVQQKGANLQQKYIAEKVFDLLKEAWNKFSSLEL